jgi:VWFA-related protein
MKWLPVCLALVLWAATPHAVQQQAFRASTDAVALDITVFDGDRVVTTLTAADFEITDNGVRQSIMSADRNVLPIDLRLVFDTSGSISAAELEKHQRAMALVAATLRPGDRCEIITFSSRIADAAARQGPPISINLRRLPPDGTSFFDAVSLAMITLPAQDRRQITIVMSDAHDNASFFDESMLLRAARRTDAVVYGIVPTETPATAPFAERLQAITLMTGGRLLLADRAERIGRRMLEALEEFRQSYVVRYQLSGVRAEGWHRVVVRLRGNRQYTIRVREGYFGR